jgi:hypothetical protein
MWSVIHTFAIHKVTLESVWQLSQFRQNIIALLCSDTILVFPREPQTWIRFFKTNRLLTHPERSPTTPLHHLGMQSCSGLFSCLALNASKNMEVSGQFLLVQTKRVGQLSTLAPVLWIFNTFFSFSTRSQDCEHAPNRHLGKVPDPWRPSFIGVWRPSFFIGVCELKTLSDNIKPWLQWKNTPSQGRALHQNHQGPHLHYFTADFKSIVLMCVVVDKKNGWLMGSQKSSAIVCIGFRMKEHPTLYGWSLLMIVLVPPCSKFALKTSDGAEKSPEDDSFSK